jgi:hypothetical protein
VYTPGVLHEDPCGYLYRETRYNGNSTDGNVSLALDDYASKRYSSCLSFRTDLRMFGVEYASFEGLRDEGEATTLYPFVLRTAFKNDTRFPGRVPQQKCGLRPAVVEYAVELTNSSIALQYRHDWRHDVHVADVAYYNQASYSWANAFTMLYPPMQVLCLYWAPTQSGTSADNNVVRLVDCGDHGYESSTVQCMNRSPLTLLDPSVLYLREQTPHSLLCNSTWRDPMPVRPHEF